MWVLVPAFTAFAIGPSYNRLASVSVKMFHIKSAAISTDAVPARTRRAGRHLFSNDKHVVRNPFTI